MSVSTPEEDKPDVEVDEKAADVKETTATPSPADQAEGDEPEAKGEDMLSAVKAALKSKSDKPPASDTPDSKSEPEADESAKDGDKAADESDELTEEELARLKPKTKKRIDNLLTERAERDKAIEELKPKAEQFERVVRFVQEAGLVPDEVNQLFDIGKNLKSDPRKAYDQIKPVYDKLQRMFGDVLPDDLQDQVNKGLMTAPNAKALAAARTDAAVAGQQAERMRAQQDETRQRESQAAHVTEVRTKVSEWESSQEKSDPDWKLKQPHVMRAIKVALLERGTPPTPAEAVVIANKALSDINAEFKALAPRKREVKPVTDVSSNRSSAKPSSALEAARAGLTKMAG